ncbi:hypothetical protein ACR80S_02450 [Halomonas sp. MA07-2]|uniref:hypothetical protein n=1 Tax=unclassified Halomonas TaxID=2609666 RepID=UPI003EEBA61E
MSRSIRAAARFALPLSLAVTFVTAPSALADSGRLEADLRAFFAGEGTLEIGEVSSALLRSRVTAEDLRFESHDGERLSVERYIVRGDYDRPDEVTLEGIRLEAFLDEPAVLSIEQVVLDEPGRPVPPRDEEALSEQWLGSLALSGLNLDLDEGTVASLASLRLDGGLEDGSGSLWFEALEIDLARVIDQAPADERTRLRMISNVLTDGSGRLRLDATFDAEWEELDDHTRLASKGQIDLVDALRLAHAVTLPVRLPEGVTPAELFTDESLLEVATLLGGELRLTLGDRGLFPRLATLGAAMGGVSEAQYLEQARTQAQGFGMMFGPQVQSLLSGLVQLMEGSASELEISANLPVESRLDSLADDPLALPERLDLRVETR